MSMQHYINLSSHAKNQVCLTYLKMTAYTSIFYEQKKISRNVFDDLPIFAHWKHWHTYNGAVIMMTYLYLHNENTDIPIMVQSL